MSTFLKAVGWLVLAAISLVVTSVTLVYLWGLFIVPFGVMALGYAHAYGLTIIAGFFLFPLAVRLIDNEKTEGKTFEYAVMHISGCGLFCLFGYLASLFM